MQLLRVTQFGTTNSATAVNVDGPACLAGETWNIYGLSLHNSSGEAVKVQLGVVTSVGFVAIDALAASVADGDAVAYKWFVWLGEGEFIRAIVTGAANAGKVVLIFSALRREINFDAQAQGPSAPGE